MDVVYNNPGDEATYLVAIGETTHEVLADRWETVQVDFGTTTRFYRGTRVVAEFRYHDSIIRKGE